MRKKLIALAVASTTYSQPMRAVCLYSIHTVPKVRLKKDRFKKHGKR